MQTLTPKPIEPKRRSPGEVPVANFITPALLTSDRSIHLHWLFEWVIDPSGEATSV